MSKHTCPQSESLVAYLYDEANAEEKNTFERHLPSCDLCREELAAFGIVRISVKEWRDDLMSTIITKPIAPLVTKERKRSALAAIREFFSLSPLWLQGATAIAALALFALLAFAALQLFGMKENQEIVNENKQKIETPKQNEQPNNKEIKSPEVANKDDDTPKPVDSPSPRKNKPSTYKPVRVNRNNEMAQNKNNPRVPKQQQTPPLSDEEILGDEMAYNADDDSLRLSSVVNPNN